jgi:hypothetical protein
MINYKISKKKFVLLTVLIGLFTVFPSFTWAAMPVVGEEIVYDIRKLKLKVGEAKLAYQGEVALEGRKMVLITFKASAVRFLDEEKIYLDPDSLLPLYVERNLNLWGKKEQIKESYDHVKGEIKIIKKASGKTTEQVLKNKGPIENIYGFIYRYRMNGSFRQGDKLDIHLPTKDIQLELVNKTKVKAEQKEFEAYYMESKPKQYRVWFESSDAKIPLRIDGAVGLAQTSMIMREYKTSP